MFIMRTHQRGLTENQVVRIKSAQVERAEMPRCQARLLRRQDAWRNDLAQRSWSSDCFASDFRHSSQSRVANLKSLCFRDS